MSAELEQAFDEYRNACYGDAQLSRIQLKEVRQAFLSGIHWLNTRSKVTHDPLLEEALRKLLGQA